MNRCNVALYTTVDEKLLQDCSLNFLKSKSDLSHRKVFFFLLNKQTNQPTNSACKKVADIPEIHAGFSVEAECVLKQLFRDPTAVASKIGSHHCHSLNYVY